MSEIEHSPLGWIQTKIEEVTIPISTSNPSDTPHREISYLDIGSINNEFGLIEQPKVLLGIDAPSRARQIVIPGDTIYSTVRPYLQAIAMVPSNLANPIASTGFCVLRPCEGINKKYLFYFVRSDQFLQAIVPLQRGVSYPAVRSKDVLSRDIPLPPTNEQNLIIDKLEEIFSELDAGVKELKAAQTKLSQYRQSLLKSAVEGSLTQQWRAENSDLVQETGEQLLARILKQRREQWQQKKLAEFAEKGKTPPKNWQYKYPDPVQPDTIDLPKLPDGWVWASLSQLVDLIQIGPFGSLLHKSDYISGGIPLINPTHIKNLKIEPDYNLSITEEKLNDLQKYVMSEGDIVIGRRGEMGRCALVSDKEDSWLCGTGSLFIRVLKSLNPEFYTWVLSSKRTKDFLAEFSVGTTMQNLNQKILHSIPVPLLPEYEQTAASDILHSEYDRIDKKIEDIKIALKQSEAQRKNILKSAFSGQLVPQDSNDEPASVLLEKIKQEREASAKKPKTKQIKTKAAMKKITVEELAKWVGNYKGNRFTFEELQTVFQGNYDQLKGCIFDMLSAQKPLFKQVFDQKLNTIMFIKEEK